jgi:hypothetical protein
MKGRCVFEQAPSRYLEEGRREGGGGGEGECEIKEI